MLAAWGKARWASAISAVFQTGHRPSIHKDNRMTALPIIDMQQAIQDGIDAGRDHVDPEAPARVAAIAAGTVPPGPAGTIAP